MRKTFVNPEDATLNKGALAEVEHPDVARVKRAHINALENAVPFFAVAPLYAATGGSLLGAKAYFLTFVAARLLHSLFYLWGRQPFRTLSFGIGILCVIGMGVHVLRAVILASRLVVGSRRACSRATPPTLDSAPSWCSSPRGGPSCSSRARSSRWRSSSTASRRRSAAASGGWSRSSRSTSSPSAPPRRCTRRGRRCGRSGCASCPICSRRSRW